MPTSEGYILTVLGAIEARILENQEILEVCQLVFHSVYRESRMATALIYTSWALNTKFIRAT